MNRKTALQRAVAYLTHAQAADGSFAGFSSAVRAPFTPTIPYRTTFVPSILLASLSDVPAAKEVRQRTAAWLLEQRSTQWSFNYWAKNTPERTTLPYPDDLDDTMCAYIGLRLHDASLVDETALGHIVKLLFATETAAGGPYHTWLAAADSGPEWQDVDLAVNSNIAYFLRLVAEPLPALTALMEQAIITGTYTSPYYPSAYPLYYYIARAYNGPKAAMLAAHILRQSKDGHWQTPLHTALALSALSKLGVTWDRRRAIAYLLHAQANDGSWPADAFCIDPRLNNTPHYHGSAALTTALALEALSSVPKTPPPKQPTANRAAANLHTRIFATAAQEIARLHSPLKEQSLLLLKRMRQVNNHREIVLLPFLFAQSLHTPKALPDSLYTHFGLANLYGWMAYTVFDDFLDNEGIPAQLPAALTALRASLTTFMQALPQNSAYQAEVQHCFAIIDNANTWEVTHTRCRHQRNQLHLTDLPQYGKRQRLAERSLGHALPALGILAAVGISPTSAPATAITQALTHYLIARQLSDDMHDWPADVTNGRITYVVTRILKDLKIPPGKRSLGALIPKMQRQFWQQTVTDTCRCMQEHLRLARVYAKKSGVLAPENIITTLCNDLDRIAATTLNEQASAQKFLAAYQAAA